MVHADGSPTEHFADPLWVYEQFCRRKGDSRSAEQIREEGQQRIQEVRGRGLFIAQGVGKRPYDLQPQLATQIQEIYADGKACIWAEFHDEFVRSVPHRWDVVTESEDRLDYILHPKSGERLAASSVAGLQRLRQQLSDTNVQLIVSDGLNAHSIMDEGHLLPFLQGLEQQLREAGFTPGSQTILVRSGRVRTGYRIGEILFSSAHGPRSVLHVIGERPGSGHHTFSVYMTTATGADWATPGKIDHNLTKVVSGIAKTALPIDDGVEQVVRILEATRSTPDLNARSD